MLKPMLFIIGILLLTLVAAETDMVFKQYDSVDLKVPCFNNGTYCSGSATCNITINYPNGTNFVNNQLMTNQVSFHNYTITQVAALGTYQCIMMCTDVNASGHSTFTFEVTPPGGPENNTTLFMILSIASVAILILAFIFKNHIFAFISGLLFMGTGVYTLIYGFANITSNFTQIISYVIIGLGIIIMFFSVLEIIEDAEYGRTEEED